MLPEIKGTPLPCLPWGEISFDEVLHYHEEACITLQRGQAGELYLTWWSDADADTERWICLPLSDARLKAVLSGEVASRDALEHPEGGYVLAVDIDLATDTVVRVVKTTAAAFPQDAIPRPQARLNIPMPAALSMR